MKKIALILGMIFLIALATSASADIRVLDTDEQAALNGSGYYCSRYYVSSCANACYGGEFRTRANKAGSCIFDHVPYTCWDAGTVMTCSIILWTDQNCQENPYTCSAWYGPTCEDDS